MLYRYAIDEHGVVTDVLTLERKAIACRQILRCAGCNDEVVPVLGPMREWHFRHKSAGERKCCKETYLHSLGKRTIAQSFEAAMTAGRPFPLTLIVPEICRRWEKEIGFKCVRQSGTRVFDLTRHFDTVEVEAGAEGYIADVLLSSSRTGERLLLEIVVTHECTVEKIGTGLRIIEIRLGEENDIFALKSGIDTRKVRVRLHNFKTQPPVEVSRRRACSREVAAFHVFESGKSFINVGRPAEIVSVMRGPKTVHTHVIDEATHGIVTPYLAAGSGYHLEAIKALKAGAPIKCCTFCRYAGFRTFEKPVFCKVKRLEVGVNEAAACPMYRPRGSLDDELLQGGI